MREAKKNLQAVLPDTELTVFSNDAHINGVASDSRLRRVGKQIQNTVRKYVTCNALKNVTIEFAGNDEFWLDLTDEVKERVRVRGDTIVQAEKNTKWPSLYLETGGGRTSIESLAMNSSTAYDELFHGAEIGADLIATILEETGIQVSAGIGSNKFVSKIGGALNKPASLTIIPSTSVSQISKRIHIDTVPGFKGKLGDKIARLLKIKTMFELSQLTAEALANQGFGVKEIRQIQQLAHGECNEAVKSRAMASRITFSRSFSK